MYGQTQVLSGTWVGVTLGLSHCYEAQTVVLGGRTFRKRLLSQCILSSRLAVTWWEAVSAVQRVYLQRLWVRAEITLGYETIAISLPQYQ